MVIGHADRPLLHRDLESPDAQLAVGVDALLLTVAAEHERAGIHRIGQQLVDRAIARTNPPNAPLTNRPPRQPLTVADQLPDDLACRTSPPPQLKHTLDRVTDLLVGAQDDTVALVAIKPDRQMHHQLAARSLVAQPSVQPRADQVQLGLRHRALQPQQQPVVEIARRIDPIGIGDQRPGQRAQIDQLMPIRRGTREPRDLQREQQTDIPQTDIGDQLLEPLPAAHRRARTTGVLINHHHRGLRPAQRDRALPQRILARRRLRVALQLPRRGLTHIHHRTTLTMTLSDLALATHRGSPPATRRAAARAAASPAPDARSAASPTPPPARPPSPSRPATPAVPTSPPPFSTETPPRRGRRRASSPASRSLSKRQPAGPASTPNSGPRAMRRGKSVHRAGTVPELPSTNRQISAVSPSSVRHPNTSSSTSRSSPGASTSRTRSGRTSTT